LKAQANTEEEKLAQKDKANKKGFDFEEDILRVISVVIHD
jgi:hypothetical protein